MWFLHHDPYHLYWPFFLLLHSEWLSGQLWVSSCIYRPRLPVECNYTEVRYMEGLGLMVYMGMDWYVYICVCGCGALSIIWPQTVNTEWQSLFNPQSRVLSQRPSLWRWSISNHYQQLHNTLQMLSIEHLAVFYSRTYWTSRMPLSKIRNLLATPVMLLIGQQEKEMDLSGASLSETRERDNMSLIPSFSKYICWLFCSKVLTIIK